MNTRNFFRVCALISVINISQHSFAGNTWDGGGSDNNFTTGPNWTGDTTPGYGILVFDNTGGGIRLSPNNNYSGPELSMNGLLFNSSLYSYTLTGNTINFFDNGGAPSKIENSNTMSQTINLTVDFENTDGTNPFAEINPVIGNLTFGSTVNMNGSQVGEIRIYGDNTNKVIFNGIINGGAGKDVRILEYSIAEYNASMAYQGETEIQKGELWIGAGGDISGSSAIYVGNGGLTGNTAKLFISDLDGGTTFDNTINVNPGSGAVGNRSVGGINTSGDNTFSGTISRASDTNNISLTLYSGGGTVSFSGDITGNDAVLIDADGSGVIRYTSSAKNYGGDTFILDGEFRVDGNYAPGNVYLGETSGSDAATFSIGTSGVTEDAGIIVRNGSSGTLTVTSAQASGDATFSGTVSLDNNLTLSSSANGRTIIAGQVKDGDGAGNYGAAVNTAGTVQLSGSVANSGTSWTVQEGTLELNKNAGTNAINGTTIVEAGGTLKNLASNQIDDSSAVTIQSNGIWNVNSASERVGSLDVDGSLSLGTGTVLVGGGSSDWGGTISASSGGGLVFLDGTTSLTGSSTGMASGSQVYVVGGTVGFNHNNAVGSATVFLGETNGTTGATINISSSGITNANSIVVRDGSTGIKTIDNATSSGSRALTFSGGITLDDSVRVDVSTDEVTTFSGVISSDADADAEGIVKRGFGTMNISNVMTFAGGMFVDEGTVSIGNNADLTQASNVTIGSTNVNGGNSAATLHLSSGAAGLDRTINVAAGAGARTISSAGNNTISGSINQSANLIVSNTTGTLNLGNVTMNTSGNNDLNVNGAGNVAIGGAITVSNGASEIFKSGVGTLTISGNNTGSEYKLHLNEGTVALDNANALGTSYTNKVNFDGNSTLKVNANVTSADLGLRVASGVTGTIDVATNNNFTVATLGALSGTGTFDKAGTGTMTLTGTSSGANTNTVSAGTLVVSNGATLSGETTIASGAKLKGSGTVGTLTINGVLAPGSSPGILTADSTTWSDGGSYEWEILSLVDAPGTSWDLLSITNAGTLNLSGLSAGGFTINMITLSDATTQGALSGFDASATYTNWLIASATTISGFSTNLFTLNSGSFVGGSGTFAIEQRALSGGGEGLFITYDGSSSQPVPEPGTWAAAALLAGAAAYVRLRRRKEVEPKA